MAKIQCDIEGNNMQPHDDHRRDFGKTRTKTKQKASATVASYYLSNKTKHDDDNVYGNLKAKKKTSAIKRCMSP